MECPRHRIVYRLSSRVPCANPTVRRCCAVADGRSERRPNKRLPGDRRRVGRTPYERRPVSRTDHADRRADGRAGGRRAYDCESQLDWSTAIRRITVEPRQTGGATAEPCGSVDVVSAPRCRHVAWFVANLLRTLSTCIYCGER